MTFIQNNYSKTKKALTIIARRLRSRQVLFLGLLIELVVSGSLTISLFMLEFRSSWFIPMALPGVFIVIIFYLTKINN